MINEMFSNKTIIIAIKNKIHKLVGKDKGFEIGDSFHKTLYLILLDKVS